MKKKEEKMQEAALAIAKVISKYKVNGVVSFGYPEVDDHTAAIVAGDAMFASFCLVQSISCIAERLDDDDKIYFLAKLVSEGIDLAGEMPDEKGKEFLEALEEGLNKYKEMEAAKAAAGPKYEN